MRRNELESKFNALLELLNKETKRMRIGEKLKTPRQMPSRGAMLDKSSFGIETGKKASEPQHTSPTASREEYINDFNHSANGQLHQQPWAKSALREFHEQLSSFKQFYCETSSGQPRRTSARHVVDWVQRISLPRMTWILALTIFQKKLKPILKP